ncbi:MAG: TlpA family protein disulfide reductase [Thiolinea sp.]
MHKVQNFRMITLIIALIANITLFSTPVSALTDMQGNNKQIEKITGQGKWTIFKVWASDCHVCQQTIHYLTEFKKAYPAADVYGISVDGQPDKAKAQAFIKRFNLKFPNLLTDVVEIDDFLYRQAGETLMGTPTMIVYNPQGKLLAVQPGPVTAKDLISFIRREEQQNGAE